MNIALLLAAGTDPTFRMDIPKQFVNVYNRPVIVYTMETFQNHPEIDTIMVACLKDGRIWWRPTRSSLAFVSLDGL